MRHMRCQRTIKNGPDSKLETRRVAFEFEMTHKVQRDFHSPPEARALSFLLSEEVVHTYLVCKVHGHFLILCLVIRDDRQGKEATG